MIDLLSQQGVMDGLKPGTKQALLGQLAARGAAVTAIPEQTILDALQRRESLGSTGVGNGLAVPHAHLPGLAKAVGLFARLARPIDFDAIDHKPVDLVFALLQPEGRADNAEALACVARILRDPDKAAALRKAEDARALFIILSHSAAAGQG